LNIRKSFFGIVWEADCFRGFQIEISRELAGHLMFAL